MIPDSSIAFIAAAFSVALALAVLFRRQRSLAEWCFSVGMLTLAAEAVFDGFSLNEILPDGIAFWQKLALAARSCQPGIWLCFSLVYSRGNYRDFLSRWRGPLVGILLGPIALLVALRSVLLEVVSYQSPQGWWVVLQPGAKLIDGIYLVAIVIVLMNFERTFRAAIGTMRWRIKFLVLGLGIILASRFYTHSQALIFSGQDLAAVNIETTALLIGCALIGIGYFRSGLREIDVYPSRAVLHTSVTALLAGAYLFIVGVLAQLVRHFGGAGNFRVATFTVLLGVVALAVLLLSERVRQKVQLFVSRHFKRPEHDFREVWTRFTGSMAAVLDESSLCGAASRLVSEIFHTLSVSIWLFDGQRQRLTCVSSTFHLDLEGQGNLQHEVGSDLASMTPHQLSRPFELRETKQFREMSVGRFRTGGDPLCVPLVAGENWLGIIILADRVGGVRYTAEELDLLKCIGDQVAVNLLNVELTREKMAGKELEAFQTISAFFIHDLKNAASTLSLMLQNLPLHFDDPLFRQDALRGIRSTAHRINHLISRLGALRHEPQLKVAEVDLNRIVSESLATLNGAFQANLKTDLAPLERISGDEEQLRSVMTNLFLNAGDAVGEGGQIRVETKQEGRWALLSILDNGCGMSPAFMKDSLFRPFRTTKKKGLGIGMFQAKIIIEAHGGKIEIKSDLGIGTTVRVMLPSVRPHQ